jgi:hypothetical protein
MRPQIRLELFLPEAYSWAVMTLCNSHALVSQQRRHAPLFMMGYLRLHFRTITS